MCCSCCMEADTSLLRSPAYRDRCRHTQCCFVWYRYINLSNSMESSQALWSLYSGHIFYGAHGSRGGVVCAAHPGRLLHTCLELEAEVSYQHSPAWSSRHPYIRERVRYSARPTMGRFQQPLKEIWHVLTASVSQRYQRTIRPCVALHRRRDLLLNTRTNDHRSQLRLCRLRLAR